MFSITVIYLGISYLLLGMTAAGISSLLLGMALVISSIAGEIEAWAIRKAMAE